MLKTPKEISRTATLLFRSLGSVSFLFLKEINTFSKDTLNLSKVSVKTFIMLLSHWSWSDKRRTTRNTDPKSF